MRFYHLFAPLALLCLASSALAQADVNFTSIVMSSNPRGDQGSAIDDNLNTFSYLTSPTTTGAIRAYLGFAGPSYVGRFRWLKTDGDVDAVPGNNPDLSDLRILYTTDVGGSLNTRTYLPVPFLTNSATEPVTGTFNPATGTITGETGGGGPRSVIFGDIPNATAMAFEFGPSVGEVGQFSHYPTTEFFALTPEPACLGLLFALAALLRRVRLCPARVRA